MRCWLIAAGFALFTSGAAFAQVTGMAVPTPTVGATSPLGSTTGSPISPMGIGLGATELPSAGISPAPTVTGSIAVPATGTACSSLGLSPTGMYGSTSTYDGGGMAIAGSTPATAAGATAGSIDMSSSIPATSGMSATSGTTQSTGMSTSSGMLDTAGVSGMCGSGSSSITASSSPTATSPTVPGGYARTGVPLGSTEIGNLGVSSAALLPTPAVPLVTGSVALTIPTAPAVTVPSTAPTSTAGCSSFGTSTSTGLPGGC
jgi:hypothetical protein